MADKTKPGIYNLLQFEEGPIREKIREANNPQPNAVRIPQFWLHMPQQRSSIPEQIQQGHAAYNA